MNTGKVSIKGDSLCETLVSPVIAPLANSNYKRSPEVLGQINKSSSLESADLLSYARLSDRSDPNFLKEEALIYFILRARDNNDRFLLRGLLEIFQKRCIANLNRKLSVDDSESKKELIEEIMHKVIADMFGSSDKNSFMQAYFWKYLKNRRIDVYRRYRRKSIRAISLDAPASMSQEDARTHLDNLVGEEISPIQYCLNSERLEEIIAFLPSKFHELFVLCFYYEIPIESNKKENFTLSRYFNVTSRTIRSRIKKIKQYLAEYKESRNDD